MIVTSLSGGSSASLYSVLLFACLFHFTCEYAIVSYSQGGVTATCRRAESIFSRFIQAVREKKINFVAIGIKHIHVLGVEWGDERKMCGGIWRSVRLVDQAGMPSSFTAYLTSQPSFMKPRIPYLWGFGKNFPQSGKMEEKVLESQLLLFLAKSGLTHLLLEVVRVSEALKLT